MITELEPAAVAPVDLDAFAAHLRVASGFAGAPDEAALIERCVSIVVEQALVMEEIQGVSKLSLVADTGAEETIFCKRHKRRLLDAKGDAAEVACAAEATRHCTSSHTAKASRMLQMPNRRSHSHSFSH